MEKVVGLFGEERKPLEKEYEFHRVKYEIASVIDRYKSTQDVYVTVQVKGTSKAFIKSVKELYQKEWLDKFSREDVPYIGYQIVGVALTFASLYLLVMSTRSKVQVAEPA